MPECFVIMGFGNKKDPDSGRVLNLDASYESIIKPAVIAAGFNCIRADEIQHSGVIDTPMYEKLLTADLVVADISTANANAIYELGVRHALRPKATILIKEVDGKFHFDLNHLATFSYKHLGEDVGAKEARTKSAELAELIKGAVKGGANDSPVYTYLKNLKEPEVMTLGGRRGVAAAETPAPAGKSIAELRKLASAALEKENFAEAQIHLKTMLERGYDDPAVVQKLALATYKSKKPDPGAALSEALAIIQRLDPATSTDPETLGVAGAIRKSQWQRSHDTAALDDAIALYGRGWAVREDHYTGENYANCLEMRADSTENGEQATVDRMLALRVRGQLVDYLRPLLEKSATKKRDDYKWMLATLSNTQLALGATAEAADYEKKFLATKPLKWERETFEVTKKDMAAQTKKYQAFRKKIGLKS